RDVDARSAEPPAPSPEPVSLSPSDRLRHDVPVIRKAVLPVGASTTSDSGSAPDFHEVATEPVRLCPLAPVERATGPAPRDANGPDASLPVAPPGHPGRGPLKPRSAAAVALEPDLVRSAHVPLPTMPMMAFPQPTAENRSPAPQTAPPAG